MKNKVLLFYPTVNENVTTWERSPLAPMAIARMVEKDYDVQIIDERVDNKAYEKLLDGLKGAICFGTSALTGTQIKYGLKASAFVREHAPDVPIIWGGWHASLLAEQTATHPLVDIVVKGQGEITFRELVDTIKRNGPIDKIPGIAYKENGRVISTPPRPMTDINEFPPMPYHLIDVEKYLGRAPGSTNDRTINYISSFGCPHRCAFCADAQVYQRKWKSLKPERVVNDLRMLKEKYNITGVFFEDSNFFASFNRVKAICQGIIDYKLDIGWEAEVRTEKFIRADSELMGLLKASGCYLLLVGAESGSQEVLNIINKDALVEDTLRFVEIAKELAITPLLSLMIGMPGVPNDLSATVALMRKMKLIYPRTRIYIFFYTPYPGTALYEKALELGLKAPKELSTWADYTLNNINTPWVDSKYREYLNILTFYFTEAYPVEYFIKSKDIAFVRIIKRVFSFFSFVRIRFNFFAFPFEYHASMNFSKGKVLIKRFFSPKLNRTPVRLL